MLFDSTMSATYKSFVPSGGHPPVGAVEVGMEAVKKDMRQHMAELRNVYHPCKGAGFNVKGLRARQTALSELGQND